MRFAKPILIAVILIGCTTVYRERIPLDWRLVDNPSAQRLEISYLNLTDSNICLWPDDWPNQAGKLDSNGGQVKLIVGTDRFPMKDFNTGYCPEGCQPLKVMAGEVITGFFLYADFDLPEELRYSEKLLEFDAYAYECD